MAPSKAGPKAFIPLARKYRPQTFDELVGQPHVTTTLTRALAAKRIGQAYLFTGQRGVGKTSAARIFAKCLNCVKGPTAQPCQQCPSCLGIVEGISLDVIEIDGASNRGIDDIRQLREQVKLAPVHGQFRVYIIDEVHQITPDAFNALLKTLEEPPAHVKFVFATTAPHKVPPTILSRCQRFDFRRLEAKTIVSALERISQAERIPVREEALYTIARSAEGSLRDAEVILEQLVSFCEGQIGEQHVTQLLGAIEQEALLGWAQALIDRDAATALRILTQQLDEGKEIAQLLSGLLWHLRNLLVVRTVGQTPSRAALLERLIDAPPEYLLRLEEQATRCSPEELLLMGQLLSHAYELTRRTPFAQAILEFAVIKLATRESWVSLEQVIQQLERLARVPNSPTPRPSESPADTTPLDPTPSEVVDQAAAPTSDEPRPPAASTDAVALLPLERIHDQWLNVLARLGQQKMSLAAYLNEARPLRVSGDCIQVGLPAFALHLEVLNAPEHIRLIEQTLREVFSQPLKVDYVIMPALPAQTDPNTTSPSLTTPSASSQAASTRQAEDPPVPPIVEDIVQLFNATIIKSKPARAS